MALFCSTYNPQILVPQIRKNSSIPRSFSTRNPFCTKPVFEISRSSNLKAENLSSLSSSVEVDNDAPSSSIVFIKGLAQSTSEGGLKTVFSQFGEVSRAKVILDKKTKKSLGFAYVWFKNEESAQIAVEEMNGKFFEGKFIYVTIAKPGSCKPRAKATRISSPFFRKLRASNLLALSCPSRFPMHHVAYGLDHIPGRASTTGPPKQVGASGDPMADTNTPDMEGNLPAA